MGSLKIRSLGDKMIKISGKYLGNKRVELTHGPTGSQIITDAPKDNNGEGTTFSPTDLTTASLGACMLTVMSIFAERNGLDLQGSHFALEKHMQENPRRIAKIVVQLHLPASLPEAERVKLERVAHTCPVHKSLSTETEIDLSFAYDA